MDSELVKKKLLNIFNIKDMKTFSKLSIALLMTGFLFSGCKKVFDIKPEDQLDQTQAYQNVYDADAAVVGIYGKFMGLADRYVILNELRGDRSISKRSATQRARHLAVPMTNNGSS